MPSKQIFTWLTQLTSNQVISKSVGRLAKSKISRKWIPSFAKAYNIPVEEAELAVGEYPSLNAFFTRRLKPGARPIDEEANSIVSPVDALITACGYMEDGKLLEVKGQTYSLEELVNHNPRAESFRSGFFYVLYLSPRDYHRIHVPVDGVLEETEEIAGRVFPVNHASMTNIRHVLSRNYRINSYIQHPVGQVGVVKVAALNVASIQFVDGVQPQHPLKKGDELAYFEFGSTIVLLLEQGKYAPDTSVGVGSRVKMGERLGSWA